MKLLTIFCKVFFAMIAVRAASEVVYVATIGGLERPSHWLCVSVAISACAWIEVVTLREEKAGGA